MPARPRPIPMLTAINNTLNLHYNGEIHFFTFLYPVGEMSVERRGNAIRIFWKYSHDGVCGPYCDGFDIAIDDIGFAGATLHPVSFCNCPET